jgi:hypothetical protein
MYFHHVDISIRIRERDYISIQEKAPVSVPCDGDDISTLINEDIQIIDL